MKISYFQMATEDIQAHGNTAKDAVIEKLLALGKLTPEDAELFHNEYAIVIVRKGWFSKLIETKFGLTEDENGTNLVYKFVKLTE